jgi:predicted NBD/HSP70 family sugar kinase
MDMIKGEHTFTYKDFSDKKRKNLAILDYIRRKGPLSRTDISKETGINIVSVSNYIMNYIKNRLVLEWGLDSSTGGRRPELVRLNLESAYVAGIDVGPENLMGVITDLGLKPKAKVILPRPKGSMEDVLSATALVLEKLFKEFKTERENIKLIGMGVSGIVDIISGTIHDTDPRRGRTKSDFYTLARSIEKKFNITTLVGNDATCAAFGEMSLSPRSDISEMLYIYSDVGCGIIINGDIYCGSSGAAGEIQLLLNHDKDKKIPLKEIQAYGIRGVDLGIADKAKGLIKKGGKSAITELTGNEIENITKETVFDAAAKGDELAKDIVTDAAYWLGVKVAYLINIFNPQVVAIGGGMENAGKAFMEALTRCVETYAYEEAFNAVKIMPSFLGKDAVSLGAASLSVRELFINA